VMPESFASEVPYLQSAALQFLSHLTACANEPHVVAVSVERFTYFTTDFPSNHSGASSKTCGLLQEKEQSIQENAR
jgi:hypothetical protein